MKPASLIFIFIVYGLESFEHSVENNYNFVENILRWIRLLYINNLSATDIYFCTCIELCWKISYNFCENIKTSADEILVFSPNDSSNLNESAYNKTSGTTTIVQAEAYKNARLIILSDSAGLVFSEPRLTGIISTTKEDTDPLTLKQKSEGNIYSR